MAKQHQAIEYPTLSWMAYNYPAIQGSVTPSEQAFLRARITGTPNCNCLSVTSFEALQLLKSAYRNEHIAAADDAAADDAAADDAAKHLDLNTIILDSSEADSVSDCPSLEV